MITADTLVVSAEPAQTIVWSIPGRGNVYEPSGYLQRQDVINGKVNEIVEQYHVHDILVVGSMPVFVEKVFEEIKEADTIGIMIDYAVI